jgi:hypothetical protein
MAFPSALFELAVAQPPKLERGCRPARCYQTNIEASFCGISAQKASAARIYAAFRRMRCVFNSVPG